MSRCFLTLFLLVLTACDGDRGRGKTSGRYGKSWGNKENKVADWRVLVETATVTSGSVSKDLVTHGRLESEAMADITPETAGVVTEIRVEEGDLVRKGQVLGVLSNPSLEAGSERASVELAQAQRRFDQSKKLHETGAISDTEFLEAKDAFEIAQTGYKEASGARGFTRLTSPVDGTVAVRNVRLGELAGSAAPAFQVVDLDRLRVIVNLSEGDLDNLQIGQPVSLAGTYNKTVRANGTVLRISPVVDESTGTIRVTIAVEPMTKDGPQLRPGQFVEVRIEVDRHDDVVTIPRKAIQWLDGAPIVWRVIDKPEGDDDDDDDEKEHSWKDNKGGFFAKFFKNDDDDNDDDDDPWAGVPRRIVERVNLTLGYTDANRAEVQRGLVLNDLIVTIGGDNLRQDAAVKLPGDPSPKKDDSKDSDDEKEAANGKPE